MPVVTKLKNWYPIIGIVLIGLFWSNYRKATIFVLILAIGLTIGDQLSSNLLKKTICRVRPCYAETQARVLTNRSRSFSFPSSHAANTTLFFWIFTYFYRRHRSWLWLIPLIIGYSRIYTGVHYPLDVVGGWALGTLIAFLVIIITEKLAIRWKWNAYPYPSNDKTITILSIKEKH